MKVQEREQNITVWFIRIVIICSMLSVWKVKIGGMELLPILLFVVVLAWMMFHIIQVNRGQRSWRQGYGRLDFVMGLLLLYELAQLVVTLFASAKDEVPDYSLNLLIISLVMLYLMMMEQGSIERSHLDLILYCGLAVMTVFLLGYLCNPKIGEILILWGNRAAASSYLLLVATVGVLQYCTSKIPMQSYFYAMCTFVSFFLLGCNHSIISFWIMGITILLIPILLRPTALLFKRAMQMLFAFLFLISNMSLVTNYTKLLLVETSYDLEHSVYLDLLLALGGVLFFHFWDRIPEKVRLDKIVLRKLYRVEKRLVKTCLMILLLLLMGGSAWQSLDGSRMSIKALQGFAVPLWKEIEGNQSFLYHCVDKQGVLGAFLCIMVVLTAIECVSRSFGWDKKMQGLFDVVLSGILLQLLAWRGCINILPIAVIILTGAIQRKGQAVKRLRKNAQVGKEQKDKVKNAAVTEPNQKQRRNGGEYEKE